MQIHRKSRFAVPATLAESRPVRMRAGRSPEIAHGPDRQRHDGGLASDFFSNDFRQDLLVQGQIGDQAFQAAVLLLQLPQLAQLGDAEAGVLLLPDVERGFADARLLANVRDERSRLGQAQRVDDLFFGEPRLLHRSSGA